MTSILTTAIEEAYAAADREEIVFHTLELYHSELAAPVRVVTGREDDLDATLESDAPRNASTEVTFTACEFSVKPAGTGEDGPVAPQITIDGVASILRPVLEDTLATNAPIQVIHRVYLSNDLSQPGEVWRGMVLERSRTDGVTVSGDLRFPDVRSQAFPLETYSLENYPALYQL